jgi:hypothetical protein
VQAEDLLSDGRFEVFNEKHQLLQSPISFIRQNDIGIIYQQLCDPFLYALVGYQVEAPIANAPHQESFLTLRHQDCIIGKNRGKDFAHHILAFVIIGEKVSG